MLTVSTPTALLSVLVDLDSLEMEQLALVLIFICLFPGLLIKFTWLYSYIVNIVHMDMASNLFFRYR